MFRTQARRESLLPRKLLRVSGTSSPGRTGREYRGFWPTTELVALPLGRFSRLNWFDTSLISVEARAMHMRKIPADLGLHA